MLFTVITIENENGAVIVTGSTTVGYIKGIWKEEAPPVSGERYSVELSFPSVDVSAVTVTSDDTGAKLIGDKNYFTGVCEDIDKVHYIRFSVDSLEMLDIINSEDEVKKGDSIMFSFHYSDIGILPELK